MVTVVAPALGTELTAAAGRGAFTHHAREFATTDVDGMWLVVAATDDRAVNAAVAAAANAARIPCNVVDDRELSSFIMPAIIDRSPVQIAVSTGGTSPVLARLIRERLETLLDGSLGLAGRIRRSLARARQGEVRRISARAAGFSPGCSPGRSPRRCAPAAPNAPKQLTQQGARRQRLRFRTGTWCWWAPGPAMPGS